MCRLAAVAAHLKELQLPWLAMHAQQLPVADERGLAHLTAQQLKPHIQHSKAGGAQQQLSTMVAQQQLEHQESLFGCTVWQTSGRSFAVALAVRA